MVLKSRSNPGKIGVLVGMKQTDVDFYCSKKGERIKMFKSFQKQEENLSLRLIFWRKKFRKTD